MSSCLLADFEQEHPIEVAGEYSLKKTECVLLRQSHQSNTNLIVELESERFTFMSVSVGH